MTVLIDREQEKRMLRAYHPDAVMAILKQSASVGAKSGAKVMRSEAPIGTADRLSQYYRKMGLPHGTFRKSVRAAEIRGRGSMIKGLQGGTVGQVIGPIGKYAFTRGWIELGTVHQHANAWVERVASKVLEVARGASEAVLALYMDEH